MRLWLLMFALAATAWAPPQSDAPEVVVDRIDPSDWTAVLQRFVDKDGLVDYVGLSNDRSRFDRYLAGIRTFSPDSDPERFPTEADRLAYWINAYNAHVFDGVLDRGPEADSVWSGAVSGFNFFVRRRIVVGGQAINLKGLEDQIIRRRFDEPRIHAALNCASIGCPDLHREAFVGDRLDAQLDQVMRGFVNDPRFVRVDEGTIYLSKIFEWYEEDFGGGLIEALGRWRDEPLPAGLPVAFLDYDKRINAR